MSAWHCRTSFGPTIHGLTVALKNSRRVTDRSSIHRCSVHKIFYMFPKEKNQEIQVWWSTWPEYWTLPCHPSPSEGSLEVISVGVNWNELGHHHARTICFVEYPGGKYPIKLAKSTHKKKVVRQILLAHKDSQQYPAQTLRTAVDVSTELYYVVYVIRNVSAHLKMAS